MKNFVDKVSVVLPTYNSQHFLEQCLPPLLEMDYPDFDIYVVDDGSSDNTIQRLHTFHSEKIHLIQLPGRSGHSAACNAGILATDARYVYVVEHHTIVTPTALSELMRVMLDNQNAAICYSKQVNVYDEKSVMLEGARYAHYVVNQQCERSPQSSLENHMTGEKPVDTTSAGTFSFLIDKERFKLIGFFDEDYFIHINDYELTLRAKAAGFACYYVPTSINYHKSFVETASAFNYRGGSSYPKFRTFVISRNRWLLMLSYYSIKTLLLLSPALIVYETFLIGFALRRKVFLSYLKAVTWLISHPEILIKKRKSVQGLKVVEDRALLRAGELNFVPGLTRTVLEQKCIKYLTAFLSRYWNLVRLWV